MAVECAHRHLAEVGLVWQIPAEDPALMLAEFARLAAQLGAREVVDSPDPVASVHALLAEFPAGWLLVFDNAPGQEAVQQFLPPAGRGRVLITSKSAAWAPGQAMEVPVLGTEVAAGFSGEPDRRPGQAGGDGSGRRAGRVAAGAGAGRRLHPGHRGHPRRLLAVLRDRRADLLARGYPETVAATLDLALSWLKEEAPAAVGLLRLLACLAPEPVPLNLLLSDGQIVGQLTPDATAMVGPLLMTPSQPGTQSPRCAATRWSLRPGMAWCWCIPWSRPSSAPRRPLT